MRIRNVRRPAILPKRNGITAGNSEKQQIGEYGCSVASGWSGVKQFSTLAPDAESTAPAEKDPRRSQTSGVGGSEAVHDPNELIRFPDGYDAPRWWTGTGQAFFDDSRWH